MAQPSVLVVEDHPHVARSIEGGLATEGYSVRLAESGDEGLSLACKGGYDLVILDVMLPGASGFDILAEMRRKAIGAPVLMLTARGELMDRLRGFEQGADDYLAKPFALPELLARVRALLNRTRSMAGGRLRVADLEVDLISRRATRAGRVIDLAPKEFELLAYLMSHAGKVVSREMLGQHVWDALSRGTPLDNVIDVHVGRLRRKVDSDATPRLIHTVRGLGFMVGTSGQA
ncbi:MAG: response regulator transcription factor [Acidobacteria bacterium]|nr:response regulator transcription factor [Acidobacteriota bacterium]